MKTITKKRLFFDLETSFCVGWFWRTGKQFVSANQILEHSKIISAHWKWEHEDEVRCIDWGLNKQCDKRVLKALIKEMNKADELIFHNGDKFDLKWVRARAMAHGLEVLPYYKTIDTLKLVKKLAMLPSYSLGNVCKYYNLEAKIDAGGFDTWRKVQLDRDAEALKHLLYYGNGDIISLEALYNHLKPYVEASTHYGVHTGAGDKWSCPECGSMNVHHNKKHTTKAGTVQHYMRCGSKPCRKVFKISNRDYQHWLDFKHGRK